ncbi:MAG: tRNA (adenosine(37)-N6)-threonylcarbamoyltransferase complex ATPase subunit type 1 TsaE [Pseudomonadota bacterium]
MSGQSTELRQQTQADVTALAVRLGDVLRPGMSVLLSGPVGAGKSHLARSLIRSILSEPEDVPSPTFTIVQTYETDKGDLWHVDLYRLSSLSEIEELGLTEALDHDICIIEWPDRLGPFHPKHALEIGLQQAARDDTRDITLSSTDPAWQKAIGDLICD